MSQPTVESSAFGYTIVRPQGHEKSECKAGHANPGRWSFYRDRTFWKHNTNAKLWPTPIVAIENQAMQGCDPAKVFESARVHSRLDYWLAAQSSIRPRSPVYCRCISTYLPKYIVGVTVMEGADPSYPGFDCSPSSGRLPGQNVERNMQAWLDAMITFSRSNSIIIQNCHRAIGCYMRIVNFDSVSQQLSKMASKTPTTEAMDP